MDVDATPDAAREPERPSGPFDAQPGPRAQLTAVVEVLSVLARSASSQTEVFDAVVSNARRLCGADVALIHLLTDDGLEVAHSVGLNEDYVRFATSHPIPVDRNGLVGRVTIDHTTQQIHDVPADPGVRPPRLPADRGGLPHHPRRPDARRRRGRRGAVRVADLRSRRSTIRICALFSDDVRRPRCAGGCATSS